MKGEELRKSIQKILFDFGRTVAKNNCDCEIDFLCDTMDRIEALIQDQRKAAADEYITKHEVRPGTLNTPLESELKKKGFKLIRVDMENLKS